MLDSACSLMLCYVSVILGMLLFEENSSVFSLIRLCWLHQRRHAGSKTLHQQNPPVVNWRCWLTQVDQYYGHKIVVVLLFVGMLLLYYLKCCCCLMYLIFVRVCLICVSLCTETGRYS